MKEEIEYKALLLDLGGVLSTNAPRMFIREFAVKHDLSLEEVVNAFRKHFGEWLSGKIDEKTFWNKFLGELNLPMAEDEFFKECSEMFRLFIVVDQDMLGYLKTMKEKDKGLKLAILSNCPKEIATYTEEEYDLGEIFDALFFSGRLGMSKPDKAMFEHAAKELGVKIKDCTFVDDRERNTKPAEEAGMQAILFKSLDDIKQEEENE